MRKNFGVLPTGEEAWLYTIQGGGITASVTDYGACLVSLLVPDSKGNVDDVVLGWPDVSGYITADGYLGATVGRSANRIKGSQFALNGQIFQLEANEGPNSLHSGSSCYCQRLWQVKKHTENTIILTLHSSHNDQGFPGNADIAVTYHLDADGGLHIIYDGVCDRDTVMNLTNHSYFNLAGHKATDKAMDQILSIPGRFFNVADKESIPTGELRSVAGTPMDFRKPTRIGQRIDEDYEPLTLQGGYDHNYEVFCNPCAQLSCKETGRLMAVYTDLPGVQFYAGNFLNTTGKEGARYSKRSGIALETQFYPDSVNHPEWPQPFVKAGERYHTETVYRFSW